ncbi:MAG: hypothetical protein JRE23_16955, partial [Deltaproteobacteria bacterium]|nr:hypothetical protein [Deltaproteobacteria bacterium]
MAQLRDKKMHVGGSAQTSGLDLSAGRDVIDETQLWEVEGLYANEDKVLAKRPSFVQWGTQVSEPTPPDASVDEEVSKMLFLNAEDWGDLEISGSSISALYDHGALVLSGWESTVEDGPGSVTASRALKGEERFNPTGGFHSDVSISFILLVKNLVEDDSVTFDMATVEDRAVRLSIRSDGIGYYGESSYVTFAGSSLAVDGNPHRVDILVTAGQDASVYIDGTKVAHEIAIPAVFSTSDSFVNITAVSTATMGDDPYVVTMSSIMLKDSADTSLHDTFTPPTISDLATVRDLKTSSQADVNSLLMASERYLWYDYGLREIWRPIAELTKKITRFSKFRGNTIVCNYSENSRATELYEYNAGKVERLTDAPDMRFTTEFTNRIWGAGDIDHPLRVYYSGDRQSNTWYNPSDPNIP